LLEYSEAQVLQTNLVMDESQSRAVSKRFPGLGVTLLLLLSTSALIALMVGWSETRTMVLLVVLGLLISFLARRLASPLDRGWIPNLVVLAWGAKMVAAAARYWALQVLYGGAGDATGYQGAGRVLAPVWRSLQVPFFERGTTFVDAVTGLLYVPQVPTKLGGFLLFATLAFLGQMLLYSAFRHAFPGGSLKWYAGLIFFFPNLLYWPASIGKDSLMLLFIGVAAYAVVRITNSYQLRWVPIFASGALGCAWIRSHISLALVIAFLVASLFGRSMQPRTGTGRFAVLVGISAIGVFIGQVAARDFGLDPGIAITDVVEEDVIDPIFTDVEDQTSQGGSAVEGKAIRSPGEVPGAILRVIFRPLPPDAHNVQALANSLVEGSFLLLLFIWRTPTIVRSVVRRIREPYILFCLTYAAAFIYGHSAILNLGIVARQRSQVMPFVLALLVALGFTDRSLGADQSDSPMSASDSPKLVPAAN
jgi:hypothetical protein